MMMMMKMLMMMMMMMMIMMMMAGMRVPALSVLRANRWFMLLCPRLAWDPLPRALQGGEVRSLS